MKKLTIAGVFLVLTAAFVILFMSLHFIDKPEPHGEIMLYLSLPFYNSLSLEGEELTHMQDVKQIFNFIYTILLISIILMFFFKVDWEKVGISILAIEGFALILMLFGFNFFWNLFHKILFPQGGWLFPHDSVLIQLYPTSFFKGFVISFMLFLTIISLFFLKKRFIKKGKG